MPSAFSFSATRPLWALVLGPLFAIAAVLAFILARRVVRARYFRQRDRCALAIRRDWERIVAGEVAAARWFFQPLARKLVEEIALDRRDAAATGEAGALDAFFRASGLLDHYKYAAREGRGWRRREAIQALGRMRAREALPLVIEALDDTSSETALDAVRALGAIGTPEAGAAIVRRLARPPAFPRGIVEAALLNCYRGDPAGLLGATMEAGDSLRPILARVLAEVAVPALAGDLAILAADDNPDVRASVARILAVARPPGAAGILCELARDQVWFVRLRAMLALGSLRDPYTLPVLIAGLCDRNRLVRLRAASALAAIEGEEPRILRLVEDTGDRYALQALVGGLDRAGKLRRMVDALAEGGPHLEASLLAIVHGGAVRIVTEAARHHPQERVRRRLRAILVRSGDPEVAVYLEQIADQPPGAADTAQIQGLAGAVAGAAPAPSREEAPPAP